jgi:hypothetical protein
MGGATASVITEEALLIASGPRVYVWHKERAEPVGNTFPGKVTGLALQGDRVLVGGNFAGVRELHTGRVVEGIFARWNHIAVAEGALYGVPRTDDPQRNGIWDVKAQQRIAAREGKVTSLASGTLADAESRVVVYGTREYPQCSVVNTFTEQELLKWDHGEAIRALSWYDERTLLYGYDSFLHATQPQRNHGTHFKRRVDSDTFRVRNDLQKIIWESRCDDVSRMWEESCAWYEKSQDKLPPFFPKFKAPWKGDKKVTITFTPMPYVQARRELAPLLQNVVGGGADRALHEVLESMRNHLLDYEYAHDRVTATARYGSTAIMGTNSGRVEEIADKEFTAGKMVLPPQNEKLYHTFSRPVAALLTVPLIVYDEGIRQQADGNRSRRAYFARREQPTVIPLKRTA